MTKKISLKGLFLISTIACLIALLLLNVVPQPTKKEVFKLSEKWCGGSLSVCCRNAEFSAKLRYSVEWVAENSSSNETTILLTSDVPELFITDDGELYIVYNLGIDVNVKSLNNPYGPSQAKFFATRVAASNWIKENGGEKLQEDK